MTKKDPYNINHDLNNESHTLLVQNLYSNALTLLKNKANLLPLNKTEKYYYIALEEGPYQYYYQSLNRLKNIVIVNPNELEKIPQGAKVIVGLHKDNSTAYKPYKISEETKTILAQLTENHPVILNLFGSPYALKDVDLSKISSILVSYENNEDAMEATAKAMHGFTKISGRLPVLVKEDLQFGMGLDLQPKNKLRLKKKN